MRFRNYFKFRHIRITHDIKFGNLLGNSSRNSNDNSSSKSKYIISALLAISEALSLSDKFESNGIIDFIKKL
jgi:hypothetical protein